VTIALPPMSAGSASSLERVRRSFMLGILVGLVVAACSPGPDAPAIEAVDLVCSDDFCVSHPVGWDTELGDGFISFTHPDAPGEAFATVGFVNMEAIVTGSGGTWPAATDEVVRSFWGLLESGGVADFASLERVTGGSFRSTGAYEDGRLWHLLVPIDGATAVGFEVRGPNVSWEPHADEFFGGLQILG
jgi:hypothetical protein